MYSPKQRNYLLSLARESIESYLETDNMLAINENEVDEALKEVRGTFVTITVRNNLRGCIGHIIPIQPLFKDVIENAVSAAYRDPRFTPLTAQELKDIRIEISVLTIPSKIEYKDAFDLLKRITPHRDGVIIKKGPQQATYLPQVWKDFPKTKDFLSSLCAKAGLSPNEWHKGELEVEIYLAEKFEEDKK